LKIHAGRRKPAAIGARVVLYPPLLMGEGFPGEVVGRSEHNGRVVWQIKLDDPVVILPTWWAGRAEFEIEEDVNG